MSFFRKKMNTNMKVSAAIQILPNVADQDEMLRIVDRVIAYIAGSGLSYEVTPFETCLEGGDLDEMMEILKNCQLIAAEAGSRKVQAYIKLLYKPEGGILTMEEKTAKFRQKPEAEC